MSTINWNTFFFFQEFHLVNTSAFCLEIYSGVTYRQGGSFRSSGKILNPSVVVVIVQPPIGMKVSILRGVQKNLTRQNSEQRVIKYSQWFNAGKFHTGQLKIAVISVIQKQ